MNSKHLILGTGPLGQSIMRALQTRANADITMVNRSGQRHADIPDSVQLVAADLYDADTVAHLTQNADVVYQCAQPTYTEWKEKFPPLQTAILDGVSRGDAKLIVGENLYMYGDTDGAPIHRHLPHKPHGTKGTVRTAMTAQLRDAHAQGKVRVAMARGSDFYGPGVRQALIGERVFDFLLEGKAASVLGNIDLPHTQTFISDFGEAMVILGEREDALGQAWHVPNAEPNITTRDLLERICAEMGIETNIAPMPKIMFEVLSFVHPTLREYREMRYELEKPYIVDSSDFIATFGDISTPIDEGIRQAVAWYRQQHTQPTLA